MYAGSDVIVYDNLDIFLTHMISHTRCCRWCTGYISDNKTLTSPQCSETFLISLSVVPLFMNSGIVLAIYLLRTEWRVNTRSQFPVSVLVCLSLSKIDSSLAIYKARTAPAIEITPTNIT
jgi:hypothetical protein